MKNETVLYIDYLESYVDIIDLKLPNWIKYLIYLIFKKLEIIRKKENVFILPVLRDDFIDEKIILKLKDKLLKSNIKNIVISESLSEKLLEHLEKDFTVLDGKWIYRFLVFELIKKLSLVQNKRISDYEITFLCIKPRDVDIENIKRLAKKCKIINVITNDINSFKKLGETLENDGILINFSTNRKKSVRYSDIVVNCDFNSSEIKDCELKKEAILIQLTKEKLKEYDKRIITFFDINIDKKYENVFRDLNHFNKVVLYESLIYYKNSYNSIKQLLKRDNVYIKSFEGIYGKINFFELK